MEANNVTYAYYFNEYSCGTAGDIPREHLDRYISKAWRELETLLTSEYTDEHISKIHLTVCEIAEELYHKEQIKGKKSEGIDGYSVTYTDSDLARKCITNIAVRNLGNTGLLYAGVEK